VRCSVLLVLILIETELFAGSHVYAPLASALITSINIHDGRQSFTGEAGMNAETFFLAPSGGRFFVTAVGTLHAFQPLSGRTLNYSTTYPVVYREHNTFRAYTGRIYFVRRNMRL